MMLVVVLMVVVDTECPQKQWVPPASVCDLLSWLLAASPAARAKFHTFPLIPTPRSMVSKMGVGAERTRERGGGRAPGSALTPPFPIQRLHHL